MLPPLNALRAFEAAARHESFLIAANELHVSAASVSRFIKMIETDLGRTLFIRHSSGVRLTDTGQQYWHSISPSLQRISQASQDIRQQDSQRSLQIIAIPAIAETWLVSRLWDFQQHHKNIEINLTLDDQHVNLHNNDTTIWMNYSNGKFPHTQSFSMPKNELTLVCSPKIAQSLSMPKDITNYPLLIDIDWQSDWYNWLDAADLSRSVMLNRIHFERYSMVVNAAISGSGVAIGHTALLKTYLDTGTLVAPFDITASPEQQFYTSIEQHPQRKSVKQFINWFLNKSYYEKI